MGFEKWLDQYFFVILPVFWILLSSMIARISGWRALAESYPVSSDFSGKWLRFQSASLRWSSNYTGIVHFGADAKGLTLSVLFMFKPGHPPIFIPWTDIQVQSQGGIFPNLRLRFSRKPDVPLVISKTLGERLSQMSGGRFSAV